VLSVSGIQGALLVSHGTFFVGNLPSIHLQLSVLAGGVQLEFSWLDAETGGNQVAITRVDTRAGIGASGPFAVISPFVEISTLVDAIGRDIELDIWQTLTQGQDVASFASNVLIGVDNDPLAALGTNTYNVLQTRWGWGHWAIVVDNCVDWRARLLTLDYQGNVTLLSVFADDTTGGRELVLLPAAPIRVVVQNFTGGATAVFLGVQYHPGPV
jgi:hypothetical protein